MKFKLEKKRRTKIHPSNSLRGTYEPDDVNSMQLHNPAPRIGRDTRLRKGLLLRRVSHEFFGSNIWIRAVANRVNWSEERVA